MGATHSELTQDQVNLLYEILDRFDSVAFKSGLTYSIACGTALGAVLRGGLIPWDTDADLFARADEFNAKLPEIVRNATGLLIIKKYTQWSDGRGWYKIYHPRAPYPNVDIYLLEHNHLYNVWRPIDNQIRTRSKMYLDSDQIVVRERIDFGPLRLPIFSYPLRFLDQFYGPQWRLVKNGDYRPSLPTTFSH